VAERQVPVRAHFAGQPRDGLQVTRPVGIVPSRVTIHGPALEVHAITAVETESIALDGLELGQHNRRVPLEHPPSHVTYVEDFEVQVRIDVVPEIAERLLVHLEVAASGVGDFTVRPAVVDIALRGPARALAAINPQHVVPFVNLEAIGTGVRNQAFKVEIRGLPESVTVVRVMPSEVLVRGKR
jgi:YbbR domain-containing protein